MAAVQALPPVHRPQMDRTGSYQSARSGYDRSTSPISRQTYSPSPLGGPPSHSRTNSGTSIHTSPFAQPFALGQNYFPHTAHFNPHLPSPSFSYPHAVHTPPLSSHPSVNAAAASAWTATPIPASAFYPASTVPGGGFSHGAHPGHQVFHQGFQQSQADFSAWAHAAAYQHMLMASAQQQQHHQYSQPPPQQHAQHQQEEILAYGEEEQRRRTSSGPAAISQAQKGVYARRQSLDDRTPPPLITQLFHTQPRSVSDKISPSTSAPGGFHPYKRTPNSGPGHRPSKESLRTAPQASVLPRSRSQPSLNGKGDRAAILAREHQRTPSLDSARSDATVQPKPVVLEETRRDSGATERAPTPVQAPAAVTPAPVPTPAATRPSQPLHSGPITSATNTPAPQLRASLLTPNPSSPVEKVKSGGLKSRFAKVLNKDKSKTSTPPSAMHPPSTPASSSPAKHTSSPSYPHTSPSESSTRSGTPPPRTPPQDLHPPSAPFALHTRAMDSEISLAETGRTEPVDDGEKKGKRGLFRMKNMSTDNISLSSTVSSASMMIRKMGSIGKLARRNSLMGISKIFKDKPKDEDAALPEIEGKLEKRERKEKEKKEKKERKAGKGAKGDPAPTQIARVSAEAVEAEDDDRTLAGLTPAAKLARQHTLRSKADDERRLSQRPTPSPAAPVKATGEPTWDNNTVTTAQRPSGIPSLASAVPPSPTTSMGSGSGAPEVRHVQPRNVSSTATVHHAVNVSEAEYDSEDDDSSDGETVEDVTFKMGRSKLSDEADLEFRSIWGNTYIDRRMVPKKGILKVRDENIPSFDSPKSSRPPSSTSTQRPSTASSPLAEHPPNGSSKPRLDFDFNFDSPPPSLELSHPNSSLPSLPSTSARHPAVRSQTVPAARRILWAPDCAVYTTYDAGTYDRRSEPATCNRLTPELALSIKQELNEFKAVMPVHPESTIYTHFFKW